MPWPFRRHPRRFLQVARVSGQGEGAVALVQLGAAIRALRKVAGFSQEALADAAGIDRSHMGKIERGERNVTLLNVVKIASALQLSVADLIARSGL
ncbi:helix-turn-helix domain-containing protein [Sphingomonas montana]|uniref:helix-turn-helix domain-containing protein n=1 Tax=Sphingomonas montana TaxID=1843236 RepID=UPI001F0B3555|nr:helix-turn-helix transcriptional regulator [Sphingomonas montana]